MRRRSVPLRERSVLAGAAMAALWVACSNSPPKSVAPGASGTAGAAAGSGAVAGASDVGGGATGAQGGAGGTEVQVAGAGGEPSGMAGHGPDDWYICPEGEVFGEPLAHQPNASNVHDGVAGFLEGPVWVASRQTLYYTNFEGSGSNGRIHSYAPDSGAHDIFLEGVGANGLAVDAAGSLLLAYHQEQRVARLALETKLISPVLGGDTYQGAPLNSVNDVVARADGHLYFTDPNYQRGDRPGQPVAGSYHLTPAGVLTLIDTQEAPNGIALSPDGRALYVAGTGNPHPLMKYAVAEDGVVTVPGTPISDYVSDGMAVDCAGNLYLTTGGNLNGVITVLTPEGTLIGTVSVDITSGTTSATFGGADHKTLFVTTNSGGLFQVPMVVPGLP